MLNTAQFSLPSVFTPSSLLQLSRLLPTQQKTVPKQNSYQAKQSTYENNSQNKAVPTLNPIANPTLQPYSSPVSYAKSLNNMPQQVEWFAQMNLYQAIAKIGAVWVIALLFLMINACDIGIYLCVVVTSFLFFFIRHNAFGPKLLHKWGYISLLGSSFVFANLICNKILYTLNAKIAGIVYNSYNITISQSSSYLVSMVPAVLVLGVLSIIYGYTCIGNMMAIPNIPNNLRQCFSIYGYVQSIKHLFLQVYRIKIILLTVYAVLFLFLYVLISCIKYNDIQYNGIQYLSVLHPIVFITECIAVVLLILYLHVLLYFIDGPISKFVLSFLYDKINPYTKIPTILELLSVKSSYQIISNAGNKNILPLFNIFAMKQSKLQNNITKQKYHNICQHALQFIINILNNNTHLYSSTSYINFSNCHRINSKIDTYTTGNSIQDIKLYNSYWHVIGKYMQVQLDNISHKLFQIYTTIQHKQLQSVKHKQLIQDILYLPKLKYMEYQIWNTIIHYGIYINILQHMLEILIVSDAHLMEGSAQLINKIKQIQLIINKIIQIEQVDSIAVQYLKKINNKIDRIISKMEKDSP